MPTNVTIDRSRYDERNRVKLRFSTRPGINEDVVRQISAYKAEPAWVLEKRLAGLKHFQDRPVPTWGPDLSKLKLDEITYFADPGQREARTWEEVPADIRQTFDRLGIPEAERTALAGAGAQYESQMAYHNLKEQWEKLGVIFENFDTAIQKYPELVQSYFMTRCVPINDHYFAALHAAVFSGGTFIYVPAGVTVDLPLQAYFRMNAPGMGQFEHTLIITEAGANVTYIEGCSAPQYSTSNLHAGCVEIFVKAGARVRYNSIENWSKNTYNLNTKRAIVEKDGVMEWINGNLGCLTEDAKIFTNPKGPISIKNIKSGDKIYAWDESTNTIKKSKVKEKIFSGTKEVFQVEAGGREIQASANHPFLTLRHRKNEKFHKKGFFHFEWLPLHQLQVGDVVAVAKALPHTGKSHKIPQYIFDAATESNNQYGQFKMKSKHLFNLSLFIPQETTPELMWLMGILLGDGHVDVGQNKINIATHVTEDYRDYVCSLLKTLFNYDVTEKKERYIIINSKVLCWLFSELGFAGNADTKHLPEWVFGLPEDQIMALLAGYFDSDGHPASNSLAFTSINKNLLYDIKHLGMSIGFGVTRIFKHGVAGEKEILGVKCQAKDSWRILFNGKKIYELPVHSARKKERISLLKTRRRYGSKAGWNFGSKTNDQVGFTRIEKIISLGIKPTWDIEVEKYHNFIANGLIVHNSGVTMLYPSSVLVGEGASTDFIGIAFAGAGQNQDTGSKAIHVAPYTSSTIIGKSISKDGGITTYRGLLKVNPGAHHVKSSVNCDALIMDEASISNTIPYMDIHEQQVDIGHEARVGKISADQLFYLQSRGLSAEHATQLVVSGFIEPVVKQLPLEYAVELNRLIELEMEGSVG